MTPALAAGVTSKPWSMEDLAALVEQFDAAIPRQKVGRKSKAESK